MSHETYYDDIEDSEIVSDCCYAPVFQGDICSHCKDHCGKIKIILDENGKDKEIYVK